MRTMNLLLAGVSAAALAQSAAGDVIMTNLALADDVGGTLFGPGANTVFKAYGWTMPDEAYVLDTVTLRLAAFNTGEGQVSIWSGTTVPQNQLIILDAPPGATEPGYFNFDFTPPTKFILEANTTYWVYVEALNGGGDGFLWGDTDPQTLPTGVATSVGFVFNGNPSGFFNVVEIIGTPVSTPDCVGDLNGSGGVGVPDLLILLAAWGPNPGNPADLDDNGDVGVSDLLILLANWGPCS